MALFKTAVIHTDTGYCGLCWQVWRDRKEKNPSAPPPPLLHTHARARRTHNLSHSPTACPSVLQLDTVLQLIPQSTVPQLVPQSHSLSHSHTACPTVIQPVTESHSLSHNHTACPAVCHTVPQLVTVPQFVPQSCSLSFFSTLRPRLASAFQRNFLSSRQKGSKRKVQ